MWKNNVKIKACLKIVLEFDSDPLLKSGTNHEENVNKISHCLKLMQETIFQHINLYKESDQTPKSDWKCQIYSVFHLSQTAEVHPWAPVLAFIQLYARSSLQHSNASLYQESWLSWETETWESVRVRGKRVALYSKKWAALYNQRKSGYGAHPGLHLPHKQDASSTTMHGAMHTPMQTTGRQTFHLEFHLGHTFCASDSYNRVCCSGNNLIISCMALYLFLIFTSLFHFKPVYGPELPFTE